MLQLLGYLPQLLLIQSILHHLPFEYLRLSASSSQYFSFCLDRSLVLPKDKHSTSISSLQAASAGLAISQVEQYPRDPKQIRREVYSAIHSLDRMRGSVAYELVGPVVNEIGQILNQAWTLIEADDGRSALTVLEAVTEAYVSEWETRDD